MKVEGAANVRTGLDLCYADVGVYELTQERAGERPYCVLCGAVDATANVRLTASDGTQVDNVARVLSLEIYGVRLVSYVRVEREATHG